jgi:Protein of unknown function (DUF3499)
MVSSPNWSQRYGPVTKRLCARAGCSAPAAAALRFQPTRREAWLVDLDQSAARSEGDLCARHASALVLPRGWELYDERTNKPIVGPEASPPRVRAARVRGTVRAVRRDLTAITVNPGSPETQQEFALAPERELAEPARPPQSEPVTDLVLAPEPESETPADAPPALEARPVFEDPEIVDEELADVLDAQTPLLRRAFRNLLPPDEAQ